MPYSVRRTPSGADVRFTGVATRAVIEAAMAEAGTGRGDGVAGYVLRDYTAAERVDVSPEDVRALAGYYAGAPGRAAPALVAIVAARAADYGMARMWEILAEDAGAYGEAHVAWSRADAVGWLVAHGVPPEELEG